MLRRRVLGLILVIWFGGAGGAWAQQGNAAVFDGTYMGELTLTRVVKGDCAPPAVGALFPLTVERGRVRFKYLPRFDTELTGSVRPNGAFVASARIKRGGAGEIVHMAGRIANGTVNARIKSPSCRYSFRAED
jgi:hypothetical protein